MLKLALFASCSCVLLDAVSAQLPAATSVPPQLVGRWLAEDIDGRGVIDDLQTTLEINGDGTYAGFAGCNSYTGTFAFRDDRIVFGPASMTRKLCPPAVSDQENRFLAALTPDLEWKTDGPRLLLGSPSVGAGVALIEHD